VDLGGRALLIQVIVGTTRQGRFSDRVSRWVFGELRAPDGVDIELVDLRDYALPLFHSPSSPARSPRAYETDEIASFGRVVDRADGYVMLTGEYNHGYPAVLKNAMDHTFVEWRRKPIAFVAWGNVGGARAVEQLRQVAVEFEMAPLRHAVHILPDVFLAARQASDQDFASAFAPLKPKLDLLVAHLCLVDGSLDRRAQPSSRAVNGRPTSPAHGLQTDTK
jgi:NAD(P)H-dependent FMN reductase